MRTPVSRNPLALLYKFLKKPSPIYKVRHDELSPSTNAPVNTAQHHSDSTMLKIFIDAAISNNIRLCDKEDWGIVDREGTITAMQREQDEKNAQEWVFLEFLEDIMTVN